MEITSNRIKSSFSKGLLIFFISMWFLTAVFIVLTALLMKELGFAIFSYIFCGVFNLIATYLIIDTLTNYVVVEGDSITKYMFLSKKTMKIKHISKIEHKDNFYILYVNRKRFVALNDRDPQTNKMLFQFERNGFNIGKIE